MTSDYFKNSAKIYVEVLALLGFSIGIGLFLLFLLLLLIYILKFRSRAYLRVQGKKSTDTKKKGIFWQKPSPSVSTVTLPVQFHVSRPHGEKREKHSLEHQRRPALSWKDEDQTDEETPRTRRVQSESESQVANTRYIKRRSMSEREERRSLLAGMRCRSKSIGLSFPIFPMLKLSGLLDFMVHYNSEAKELEVTIVQLYDIDLSAQNCVGLLGVQSLSDHELYTGKKLIQIVRAPDGSLFMRNQDEIGLSVSVVLYPKYVLSKQTSIKYGSTAPCFHETFKVVGYPMSQLTDSVLRMQILVHFDEQVGVFSIGEVAYPLRKLTIDTYVPQQEALDIPIDDLQFEYSLREDRYLGELGLSMTYDPMNNRLSVTLVDAANLPKTYGQTNTSVKVSVFFCGHRMAKEKSRVVRKSDNPTIQETFTFDIAKDKLCQIDVLCEIRQHGPVSKTVVGYVHVGSQAEEAGLQQWKELLTYSCLNTKKSHLIRRKKPLCLCF